jgi:hypothetical protein
MRFYSRQGSTRLNPTRLNPTGLNPTRLNPTGLNPTQLEALWNLRACWWRCLLAHLLTPCNSLASCCCLQLFEYHQRLLGRRAHVGIVEPATFNHLCVARVAVVHVLRYLGPLACNHCLLHLVVEAHRVERQCACTQLPHDDAETKDVGLAGEASLRDELRRCPACRALCRCAGRHLEWVELQCIAEIDQFHALQIVWIGASHQYIEAFEIAVVPTNQSKPVDRPLSESVARSIREREFAW